MKSLCGVGVGVTKHGVDSFVSEHDLSLHLTFFYQFAMICYLHIYYIYTYIYMSRFLVA